MNTNEMGRICPFVVISDPLYLPTYVHYLLCLPTHPCLPAYHPFRPLLPACLPAYPLPFSLPVCNLPACLPTDLPTYLLTDLPTALPLLLTRLPHLFYLPTSHTDRPYLFYPPTYRTHPTHLPFCFPPPACVCVRWCVWKHKTTTTAQTHAGAETQEEKTKQQKEG